MTDGPEDSFDWGEQGETPVNWDSDMDFGPGETDIDPIFLGRVDLFPDDPGNLFADVYTEPGFTPDPLQIDFSQLEELLNIPDAQDASDFFSKVNYDTGDLDFDSPGIRGPFPDRETVEDWLNSTGLWEFVDIYYDGEDDQYYLEISDSP